ncbi:hypothetical protein VPHD148_0205 [Vibrio phage D148]
MPKFRERQCSLDDCENSFTPTGPAAKFCISCAESRRKEAARRSTSAYRIRQSRVTMQEMSSD